MPFSKDAESRKAAMRAVVIIAVAAIIAAAVLFLMGRPQSATFMAAVFAFTAPIITSFITLAQSEEIHEKTSKLQQDTRSIKQQVDDVHAQANGGAPTPTTQRNTRKGTMR